MKYVSDEDDFLKNVNNIYISQKQIDILQKYGMDVYKYFSLDSLIYDIEMFLNNHGYADDLESVSMSLAEINYYNNTNK